MVKHLHRKTIIFIVACALSLSGALFFSHALAHAADDIQDGIPALSQEDLQLLQKVHFEDDASTVTDDAIDMQDTFAENAHDPANRPQEEFYRATITEIIDETTDEQLENYTEITQHVRADITNGKEKGMRVDAVNQGIISMDKYHRVGVGDSVVLMKIYKIDGSVKYYVNDHYRLPQIYIILAIFAGLTIFFGMWKGVGSLLGLGFSILVLAQYIVPRIINGGNPLTVTLVGAFAITSISLFLAHGFNRRTAISLLSTVITFGFALVVSHFFIQMAFLFGTGSEEAYYLQVTNVATINLRGLLLAGIIISTLGVLDDITTAQTAIVGELRRANPKLPMSELYKRGLVVGKEHISSLVNTLVLAYAGVGLPLFILLKMNDYIPFWLQINSEIFAEEIVRAVIGSSALILAVPIATLSAAFFLKNAKISLEDQQFHHHH